MKSGKVFNHQLLQVSIFTFLLIQSITNILIGQDLIPPELLRFNAIREGNSNLFTYDLSFHKIGLCADISMTEFTPEANFHIHKQSFLNETAMLEISASREGFNIGVVKNMFQNSLGSFGIFQQGTSGMMNYFQNRLAIGNYDIILANYIKDYPDYLVSVFKLKLLINNGV